MPSGHVRGAGGAAGIPRRGTVTTSEVGRMVPVAPASTAPARRWLPPFAALLAAEMTTLLIQGMAPADDLVRIVLNALAGLTLVLALRAGAVGARWLLAAAAVAAALLLITVVQAIAGHV